MGGSGSGNGNGVGGILIDTSVIFLNNNNNNNNNKEDQQVVVVPGVDYLLNKLQHSNIPTGISYPVDLSETKASLVEKLISIHTLERPFIYNPSSMEDDSLRRAVSLAWGNNNGVTILHLVSNSHQGLVPTSSFNYGWMNVVVNVDGNADGASKNPNEIFIQKLEDVPLTICELNKKLNEDNLVVGYIMKPSREKDFAQRGAFPLNPTQNGLIFLPLTFDLPILSQLKKVDVVIHKATDEISSIETSSSHDCSSKIIYTTKMLELQRCIGEMPNCCVIDPFDNIFPVVDRLRIQEILLGLADVKSESQHKIRGAYFLKVDDFEDLNLEQRLQEAKLSLPNIVKPQVACGVADAHSMAIVFEAADYMGLSVPLPAIVQLNEDNLVVGYIMKPSREKDFAQRGAFPLNPTQNGLIFLPLTFDLPILSQLKKVDVVIHKATDEISSIETSSSHDCSSKIIYTTKMLELQRCIGEMPNCCVIDPFDNIFPVVDRLRIQEILLGLADVKSESQHKIRGAYFLKVDDFEDLNLEQRLQEAKLSLPNIVKPQVACGVADAHSMAIVFEAADYMGLSVPLPAIVQEYVDHSSTLYKFYVLGEKVFYAVKNSTPNADILKRSYEKNGLKPLHFDSLKSLPIDGSKKPSEIGDESNKLQEEHLDIGLVNDAANHLRRVLDLTIFGFDVVIQEGTHDHVIVDVNYLPSFKEVPNEIAIPAFWDAIKMKYQLRKGVYL